MKTTLIYLIGILSLLALTSQSRTSESDEKEEPGRIELSNETGLEGDYSIEEFSGMTTSTSFDADLEIEEWMTDLSDWEIETNNN